LIFEKFLNIFKKIGINTKGRINAEIENANAGINAVLLKLNIIKRRIKINEFLKNSGIGIKTAL
jgi:hypothetical protein